MSCKNIFLNLSRTGGESVYHFRLPPSNEGMHTVTEGHPRFQALAQKIQFLHEHDREAITQHPQGEINTKKYIYQG